VVIRGGGKWVCFCVFSGVGEIFRVFQGYFYKFLRVFIRLDLFYVG
jgi:hypothetical protein